MIVTPIVGAIMVALYITLAFKIIGYRREHKISIGHGDNDDLHRAIRAHGNLTEYAPLCLILIAVLEFNKAPFVLSAILGILVSAGRLLHARAMTQPPQNAMSMRVRGMQLTIISLGLLAVSNVLWLVWLAF